MTRKKTRNQRQDSLNVETFLRFTRFSPRPRPRGPHRSGRIPWDPGNQELPAGSRAYPSPPVRPSAPGHPPGRRSRQAPGKTPLARGAWYARWRRDVGVGWLGQPRRLSGLLPTPGKVGRWDGSSTHTNDHFLTDTTKHENVVPSPSAAKCRTTALGCPWAGEGACPTLSYKICPQKSNFLS